MSTGLDCRLRATIYTRVSQRKVLHWIQKISGTQPVVMVVGGFSSHSKDFLQAKAKVITYILQGTIVNYPQYSIFSDNIFSRLHPVFGSRTFGKICMNQIRMSEAISMYPKTHE